MVTPTPEFGATTYYYRPQQYVRKGYVFTSVRHFVHGAGRGGLADTPRQTPPQADPPGRHLPPGQTPPWADPPPGHILSPWADTLPGQTTYWPDTPLARQPPQGDGHCSRWYASYWNAFFFGKIFAENCIKMKEIGPIGGMHIFSAPSLGSANA